MKIETMIGKLNTYFIDKIISNDFQLITADKFTAHIKVDEKYSFVIWIANERSNVKTCAQAFVDNCMQLNFTEPQREQVYNTLMLQCKDIQDEAERKKELAEYERLKAKFEPQNENI